MDQDDNLPFSKEDADRYVQQRADSFYEVMIALDDLDLPELERLSAADETFPDGVDPWIGRRWIINAIDVGKFPGINWILKQNVDLRFRDDEGITPLHACIDRQVADEVTKHDIMRALIAAGADVNAVAANGYTPLHLAAVRDDLRAIDLLLEAGACPDQKTNIDHYATPEQQARLLGNTKTANYLKEKMSQMPKKPRRFQGPLGLANPKALD